MEDIDINKILVSKKVRYGKESIKYYIGYNYDDVIRPLSIKLPKMIEMLNIIIIITNC